MDSITVFDLSTGLKVKSFVESPLINSIYLEWSKKSSINGTNQSLTVEYCGFTTV